MQIEGGLIFKSQPRHANDDVAAHMRSPEVNEQPDDSPWQH
jgi:hypothetical protein